MKQVSISTSYKNKAFGLGVGLLTSLSVLGIANTAHAIVLNVGSQTSTFTGLTRGFFFTAPTNFTITGLGVPTDASTDNFDVALLKFNVTPPQFSASTIDFSTLFLSRDNAGSALLATNINIQAGDIIGVFGSRGPNSINSYGANNFNTTILGQSVTLTRLIMQNDLRFFDPSAIGVSTESGSSTLGRVFINIEETQSVPEPVTILGTLLAGSLGVAFKKKQQSL
ncbi:PEP-CTERM sorting domain-containing protein [Geminocystis sp.]|uniref:PEP-CTERM sorting domain-containing protein n=1 Tax=Geminocystis sp. TaxID=2664100 RepID=UPI00359341AC